MQKRPLPRPTRASQFRNVAISNTKGAVHFIDNGVVSRIVNASTSGAVKVLPRHASPSLTRTPKTHGWWHIVLYQSSLLQGQMYTDLPNAQLRL